MISRLVAAVFLAGATATPAMAQTPRPEAQEMVDRIHLGTSGRLAAVEELPAAFARTEQNNLRHMPSGFVCQHTRWSLDGLMPGFVTIFDDPAAAENIGCGMVGRGINISIFVLKADGDPQSIIRRYTEPARENNPPAGDGSSLTPATAADLELAMSVPLAAEAWIDRNGFYQHIYVAKFGEWFVTGRLTAEQMMSREGLRHIGRQFEQARVTIRR